MNVLIVEDELHSSKLLKEIIEQDEDFLVTEQLETLAETVTYLNKHQKKLDLLFLDIQLADGHSFEIFKHIDVSIPVVFCTAYDEYTMQAIKHNGIDYILKPFKEDEIHNALKRYKQFASTFQAKLSKPIQFNSPNQYQQSFLTQHREKTLVKFVKDIALFHIELETVYMYTFSREKLFIFKSLDYIESVCDPNQFFRINRQMIVNRNNVISIEPYFNRKLTIHLKASAGEKAIVSRLKVTPFKEWLETGK